MDNIPLVRVLSEQHWNYKFKDILKTSSNYIGKSFIVMENENWLYKLFFKSNTEIYKQIYHKKNGHWNLAEETRYCFSLFFF